MSAFGGEQAATITPTLRLSDDPSITTCSTLGVVCSREVEDRCIVVTIIAGAREIEATLFRPNMRLQAPATTEAFGEFATSRSGGRA